MMFSTTLVELTAESLKREIKKMPNINNIILSGGGVKNKTLVNEHKKRVFTKKYCFIRFSRNKLQSIRTSGICLVNKNM